MDSHRAIVVMGVAGSGKSTLAAALARTLRWRFVEGDALHPPANVAKMAAGIALTDEDRLPFLRAVAAALAAHPEGAVAACSALKRRYRDTIRTCVADVVFVLPLVPRAVLASRIAQRPGHFMPIGLLDGQLATLEPPDGDERALTIDGTSAIDAQVAGVIGAMGGARPSIDRR